ncbi:MAG: hypothetical protein QOJ25_185 [Solirubrobacteraceae bacterium]|jgi:hypothetical protein|nr:hypothetical protein [Solirubrobacteraceae bacterium]
MGTHANNTRYEVELRPSRDGGRHVVRPDALPRALFVGEVVARGLTHVVQDNFRGLSAPEKLSELATPVLIRADPKADEVEALLRLPGGELALVDIGYGQVRLEVASERRVAANAAARSLRAALETEAPVAEQVSVAFWMRADGGGEVRHRNIDCERFDEIAGNYSAPVRAALERLIEMRTPDRGRLILWRGEPGTGKSHVLRALARAWSSWCSAHFIMDPDELLGRGGAYMLDVLTWDDADESRWRLLILEDAGELIAADARASTGQALSRLLNVADGILGQGTRTLVLITTNEPVKRLHPAARRPGRCLADLEFTPLSTAEANVWLADRGYEHRVERPTTLAELFGRVEEGADGLTPAEVSSGGFGFARALVEPGRDQAPACAPGTTGSTRCDGREES